MYVLQIVLSGASDDEAISGAQGVPTSTSRGKFESAPVIVSGHPTTIVPAGGGRLVRETSSRCPGGSWPARWAPSGHNWAQLPTWHGTECSKEASTWLTSTPPTSTRAG